MTGTDSWRLQTGMLCSRKFHLYGCYLRGAVSRSNAPHGKLSNEDVERCKFQDKTGVLPKRFPCEQKVPLESLKMSYGSYKSGVEKYLSSLSSPSNESVKQENRQNKLA